MKSLRQKQITNLYYNSTMSATTQDLLEQILQLEEKINFNRINGYSVVSLEEQLFQLKEKFQIMNENLRNTSNVLKG